MKVLNEFSKTILTKIFSFRSHFHWLNEIFVEEIEQKFGNPKSKSHRITYNLFTYLTEISSN